MNTEIVEKMFDEKFQSMVGYVFDEETKLHLLTKEPEVREELKSFIRQEILLALQNAREKTREMVQKKKLPTGQRYPEGFEQGWNHCASDIINALGE